MKTIELFCGTKSFSKVAKSLGHDTFTIDSNPKFRPDITADKLTEEFNRMTGKVIDDSNE